MSQAMKGMGGALAAMGLWLSAAPAWAAGQYLLVENWVHFPPGLTRWDQATGVDVDSHDNVYVFTRNKAMPIMVFDREGRFLRAWGEGCSRRRISCG